MNISRLAAVNKKEPEYLESILEKMVSSDLIISDLDDTDTYSPAKRIAYSYLLRFDRVTSYPFWRWAIPCFFDLCLNGEDAHERQWRTFREKFLSDPGEVNRQELWHATHAKEMAFPGLLDFYSQFPNAKKAYISRNLQQITDAYAYAYKFDLSLGESYNRKEAVKKVLDRFPERRRVLFKGDAKTDEEIMETLREYQHSGRIDSLVSVHVANSYSRRNPKFDLTIHKDYRGLAVILNAKRERPEHKFDSSNIDGVVIPLRPAGSAKNTHY